MALMDMPAWTNGWQKSDEVIFTQHGTNHPGKWRSFGTYILYDQTGFMISELCALGSWTAEEETLVDGEREEMVHLAITTTLRHKVCVCVFV